MASKILFALVAVLFCSQALSIVIVSKAEWGGRAAKSKTTLANSLSYAVIHHTADPYCTTKSACITRMRAIQNYHMDTLGWSDIGYNFLVGGDGNIYEGRGWNTVGAHATNWNSKAIGISYIGNYNTDKPTAAQVSKGKELLAYAVTKGQLKSGYILYGHRQVGSTECPGTNLYNEIKKWANWTA